jgi:predicted transcriptional regulator
MIIKVVFFWQSRQNKRLKNSLALEKLRKKKTGGQNMTVKDVQEILGARVLTGEEFLDREVRSACGSDMMSDVLAFSKDHSVLLTGLCNPQVIRTAEMLDIVCLVFVRGKKPDETIIEMAREREIVVLETGHRMFSSCGMLYKAGLGGGAI